VLLVAEAFAECRGVVRIDLGIVGRTRDGDVGKATIDEFGVNVCVHIHEDAFCCKTLRAVGGYGVTVIEMPHLLGIETDYSIFSSIHTDADLSILSDVLDASKVTIGDLQGPVRSRKLNFLASSEFALNLPIGGDAA